jgi:hypothetical protein
MPRVSNQLYLERHRFLVKAWTDFQRLYSILPIEQQWQVHAYYQPSKELTDQQLLEHREKVTEERPELPAQAGKAFIRMYRAFRIAFEYADGDQQRFNAALLHLTDSRAKTAAPHGKRRISVTALARPEPDLEVLARALVEMARERVLKEVA